MKNFLLVNYLISGNSSNEYVDYRFILAKYCDLIQFVFCHLVLLLKQTQNQIKATNIFGYQNTELAP